MWGWFFALSIPGGGITVMFSFGKYCEESKDNLANSLP